MYKLLYKCPKLPEITRKVKENRLRTNWSQGWPYNDALPNGSGGYYLTGCVATATAQILAYYRYPESVTISDVTYPIDWNSAVSGDIRGANIHFLMKDIGSKVNMKYFQEESSAHSLKVQSALRQYGYVGATFADFNPKQIISEIDNNRVVYVNGVSKEERGHAWVADGYLYADNSTVVVDYVELNNGVYTQVGQRLISDGGLYPQQLYFHYNWGWSGDYNGWFSGFEVNDPLNGEYDTTNYVGNGYEYTNYQRMIYNIKK